MDKEKQNSGVTNIFEEGANCQVFNGDISGCVFAMPGANVTQQTRQEPAQLNEEEQNVVTQLKPMFFGIEDDAKKFLTGIQGMKPTQITSMVNQWVKERKICEESRHRDLWRVLHDCGIYQPTEANWNMQVK